MAGLPARGAHSEGGAHPLSCPEPALSCAPQGHSPVPGQPLPETGQLEAMKARGPRGHLGHLCGFLHQLRSQRPSHWSRAGPLLRICFPGSQPGTCSQRRSPGSPAAPGRAPLPGPPTDETESRLCRSSRLAWGPGGDRGPSRKLPLGHRAVPPMAAQQRVETARLDQEPPQHTGAGTSLLASTGNLPGAEPQLDPGPEGRGDRKSSHEQSPGEAGRTSRVQRGRGAGGPQGRQPRTRGCVVIILSGQTHSLRRPLHI